MVVSKYVSGVVVPSFDEAVSEVIASYGIEGGGNTMRTAIENLDGQIYRVIASVGLGAYIHITSGLSDLGLKDVLAESIEGKGGYDSWFVVTPEILSTIPITPDKAFDAASDILRELSKLDELSETERQSLFLSRVGQGIFRNQLLSYWNGCAVSGANCLPLLKASHIKPWRSSNNRERLDPFNGLLLSPNIDAAFDAGYISFDELGKIVLSKEIEGHHAFQMHLNAKLRIDQKLLKPEHQPYLAYHRAEVFRGS